MNTSPSEYLGKPTSRVDGPAKVTGEAKYAAEFAVPNLAYGYIVSSGAARGTITRTNAAEVEKIPGVLKVFTHENAPKTAALDRSHRDQIAPNSGSPFRPLYKAELEYSFQPVALVVAETFEVARYAASLVQVEYDLKLRTRPTCATTWPGPTRPRIPARVTSPRPRSRAATRMRLTPGRRTRWRRNTRSRWNSTSRWRASPPPWPTARTAS